MPRYVVEPGTGRLLTEPDRLSQLEFLDRWEESPAEPVLTLLFSLEVQASAAGAAARRFLTRFRSAEGIDPTDPRTIAGTDAALAMGVQSGTITQGQADAARAAILAPVPARPVVAWSAI